MISIMIPCFSVDDKLGDWTNCRSLFRHLCVLDLGVLLDHNNGNWWTDYSRDSLFKYLWIIRTLGDHVEHQHRRWICRINGLCSD